MDRIFILGAGFSAPAGFPTHNDLFLELRTFYEEELYEKNLQCLDDFKEHHKIVESLIDFSGDKEYGFETFLSLIESGLQEGILLDEYKKTKKGWILVLCFYLFEKLKKAENLELYYSFCNFLKDGEAILTFNWDILLEDCLTKQNRKWEYRNKQGFAGDGITIYKMHGSINWSYFDNPDLIPKDKSFFQLMRGRVYTAPISGLDKTIDQVELQTGKEPFVVPPTF